MSIYRNKIKKGDGDGKAIIGQKKEITIIAIYHKDALTKISGGK